MFCQKPSVAFIVKNYNGYHIFSTPSLGKMSKAKHAALCCIY